MMLRIALVLAFSLSPYLAFASSVSDRGELGPATSADSLLGVDDTGGVGTTLKRILFSAIPGDYLNGAGGWFSGMATASKAAAYTVGTDSADECYGGVIYVTSAATVTACDNLAAGMRFKVITIGAIAVSVDAQADDRMYLDGVALDDGDKATNTSTTGDSIECYYESADGWYCESDGWSDGGA